MSPLIYVDDGVLSRGRHHEFIHIGGHESSVRRADVHQDKRYLTPIIKDVLKEDIEREEWDSMVVERQKKGAKKH